MLNESRIDLYDYICGLFSGVSENIYSMKIPSELTESDVEEGFLVVRIGDMYDESEFPKQAYGDVRVFVSAYVPFKSRGRINKQLYKTFETAMNEVVSSAIEENDNEYYTIQNDGILSMDDVEESNANNSFSVYVKSFVVTIN